MLIRRIDTAMENPSLKAFVIGPIGDREARDGTESRIAYEEGVQVLEEVIIPACHGFGIEALRSDGITTTGEIPEQIFRQLRDCAIVIADLTGANPNVMYELGLRHTTGKLTIQIGERDRLPFDVAAIRTIMFKRTESGLVQARKDLAKMLAASLDTGGDPVTATRIWFEPAGAPPESVTEGSSDGGGVGLNEADDDSPGFLELLADMEEGIQSLVQTLNAATSITDEISRVYVEAANSVRDLDAHGGGAAGRLVLANKTAAELEAPANRLAVVAGDYEVTVARIEPGLLYTLKRLHDEPDQLAEIPEFPTQISGLVKGAALSVDGAREMGRVSEDIGKISRSLKRVGSRLGAAFTRIAAASSRVASWQTAINSINSQENGQK